MYGSEQGIAGYAGGIDFGPEFPPGELVDAESGVTNSDRVPRMRMEWIDTVLRNEHRASPGWALQNPADWVDALERPSAPVMWESQMDPGCVVGSGVDFTGCSNRPHDWRWHSASNWGKLGAHSTRVAKLWKHHGAQGSGGRITALARARGERFLPRYGGKYSSGG